MSDAETLTLEDQLAALATCGVSLRPPATRADVLADAEPFEFEEEPYTLLLVSLGAEQAEPPFAPLSDGVWYVDFACIEGPDDYAEIARRTALLTRGDLVFEAVRDLVDIDSEEAWLEVTLAGESAPRRFEAHVADHWLDPNVFAFLDDLIAGTGSQRRLIVLGLDDEDALVGCATAEELERLRAVTELDFQWMVERD